MSHLNYSGIPFPAESDDWLAANPNESKEELEEVWSLAGLAGSLFEPDSKRISQMRSVLATAGTDEHVYRPVRRATRSYVWMAAAIVLIAVGVMWWLQPIEYAAPAGATLVVDLPDGSQVTLNSGASIERSRAFGWRNRNLRLTGEAYFDISHGKGRFEVTTFNGRVEVTGTRFDVRAWETDPQPETRVFVEEGTVVVASRSNPEDQVVLHPGQSALVRGSEVSVLDPGDAESQKPFWKTGGMDFKNAPLGVILDEIERRYAIEIEVTPDSLRSARISIHAGHAELGTILGLVANARDLDVVSTAQGYRLIAR